MLFPIFGITYVKKEEEEGKMREKMSSLGLHPNAGRGFMPKKIH